MWIALLVVAVLAVARGLGGLDDSPMLGYFEDRQPVIIRATAPEHTFPKLGIRIAPPDGWTYLSLADDAVADRLTFVNESTHCIISFRRFRLPSWPPADTQPVVQRYGEFDIQWVQRDHRCIGRLTRAEVDLAIMVMTHQTGSPRDESTDEFCAAIEILETR